MSKVSNMSVVGGLVAILAGAAMLVGGCGQKRASLGAERASAACCCGDSCACDNCTCIGTPETGCTCGTGCCSNTKGSMSVMSTEKASCAAKTDCAKSCGK